MYFKGRSVYVYRVSNNGKTGWRPAVQEIQVFSDRVCSTKTLATYVDVSGSRSGSHDGIAAFDDNIATEWRPQCSPCTKNEAWVIFTTNLEAKCINAGNLGRGPGGHGSWNIGIYVELKNLYGSWGMVMESQSENIAKLGIRSDFYL